MTWGCILAWYYGSNWGHKGHRDHKGIKTCRCNCCQKSKFQTFYFIIMSVWVQFDIFYFIIYFTLTWEKWDEDYYWSNRSKQYQKLVFWVFLKVKNSKISGAAPRIPLAGLAAPPTPSSLAQLRTRPRCSLLIILQAATAKKSFACRQKNILSHTDQKSQ